MTQAAPTNLLLAQAVYYIQRMRREYSVNQNKLPDEINEVYQKYITLFEENLGKSVTVYDPLWPGEPPNSSKMNRFLSEVQVDSNLLQQSLDILKASVVETHNMIKVEIQKAKQENLRSQNRLKTLELYSNVDNSSLIYLGDTFITEDMIDWNAMSDGENRLSILGRQTVGLSVSTRESALSNDAKITILDGSNGLLGNWRELQSSGVATTPGSPTLPNEMAYSFRSEMYSASDLNEVIDTEPTTWIEFEKYWIDWEARNAALNYGFTYQHTDNPQWDYLAPFVESDGLVNWADGLGTNHTNGTLVLNLEVDLGTPQKSNIIKLTPFGLPDNANNPIKIKSCVVSLDKTVWHTLGPQNLWIANGIDRKIVDINDENIIVGQGTWIGNGDPIRYVRFSIEQPYPINRLIGHHYYVLDSAGIPRHGSGNTTVPRFGIGSGNGNGTWVAATTPGVPRQNGPIPTLDDPNQYMDGANLNNVDLVQKLEVFNGKRWAIGIRDIEINNILYHESGAFVSRRFDVPGIVDRVALDAEVVVPAEFDQATPWVKFFVTPNDGKDWFPISRIQDDFLGIPEILAFNDPIPVALREPGVGYHSVSGTVNSLRLKVEMSRPSSSEFSTPILKPYKLKVKIR